MSAAAQPVQPATWVKCRECDGSGGWYETVRVTGEAFDADQREVECDRCDGEGGWPGCPDCDEPLDDCECGIVRPPVKIGPDGTAQVRL